MGWDRYRARVALFTHVYHARRMSNAIVVADSRAVERYLGLHPTRQVGAPDALHPIDERAGY